MFGLLAPQISAEYGKRDPFSFLTAPTHSLTHPSLPSHPPGLLESYLDHFRICHQPSFLPPYKYPPTPAYLYPGLHVDSEPPSGTLLTTTLSTSLLVPTLSSTLPSYPQPSPTHLVYCEQRAWTSAVCLLSPTLTHTLPHPYTWFAVALVCSVRLSAPGTLLGTRLSLPSTLTHPPGLLWTTSLDQCRACRASPTPQPSPTHLVYCGLQAWTSAEPAVPLPHFHLHPPTWLTVDYKTRPVKSLSHTSTLTHPPGLLWTMSLDQCRVCRASLSPPPSPTHLVYCGLWAWTSTEPAEPLPHLHPYPPTWFTVDCEPGQVQSLSLPSTLTHPPGLLWTTSLDQCRASPSHPPSPTHLVYCGLRAWTSAEPEEHPHTSTLTHPPGLLWTASLDQCRASVARSTSISTWHLVR